ncbi:heterokaryon incompatibility protein het-E-1 [Fusarium subglutinans]|uniref:Heterokaryon incompatibility protein het-E-1 n=1 Tax=Gibberella subglutinans TaxID=42677 RepID=A0A8H5UIN1_GIBSU|nr:heterokaryon incompatibility protein het-E-1 [Fusarium subglutinans]KAF5591167.1 heterokaryon incompatibility protein het-E-1 [Fusarium subglutinans]
MTDLIKLLSDSSVSAQQAAEKLASPCLEAIKKNEDAAKIEGQFDSLWSSVLSAAEQTPHDKQGKLVETLHAIKSLRPSAETAKKVVVWGEEKRWDELPMFGGKAREQLDIAKEKSDEAFVNITGFFARATAAGVDDLSLFAIWTLREALEDPAADKISEASPKLLKSSSVWFIYAADALAKASKDGKQFDGKVAKPGASLAEFKDEAGWRGFNSDRWKVWLDRFSTLKEADLPHDSKSLVAPLTDDHGMRSLLIRICFVDVYTMCWVYDDLIDDSSHFGLSYKPFKGYYWLEGLNPSTFNQQPDFAQPYAAAPMQLSRNGKLIVMALSLRDSARLKPDIRLAQAVSEFEAILTSEQKIAFRASRSSAATTAPTMSDVMRLTAEIDLKATSQHGRGRCFGPRMTNLLQAIQQFAALGDVVVGGSQNLIACGVWAAARMTVHVITGYFTYLEKLSFLFMAVGRNAPRYQAMAAIYPKSKNLQRYLCEYFIIVTRLCFQSISWTRKSAFSRLSTSISDPDMKEFQSELDIWSSSIKEEANLLLNQKIDEEAKENTKFRKLTTFLSESSSHQRRIKICARFLQACSQYDYRTTWKQTRKSGTTRLLESFSEYQRWKFNQSSYDSVLFCGKLGAGKSVLLANVVDDLNLQNNAIVLYFFARYDRHDGLNARIILGCLIRQLLEHFVANRDLDHIFQKNADILDVDDIVGIFKQLPPHTQRLFIVIDGIDECPMSEQHDLLKAFSVIQPCGYKLCISARVLEKTLPWKSHSFAFQVCIPEDNPDILDYVQVEEVKEQLINGACGMFLWVSLQLDSICSEVTDHAIRKTIQNLPRDLTETFERNLAKASSGDTNGYHIIIFKLLVAARELLSVEQLREAASVVVGQTTWNPGQQINHIDRVLRFCGSLVMVDEEDETVRFIHHSARSFCLNSPNNSAAWTFNEDEAERSMAETLVTYLSYNVFDTRLSRNVVPKIEANDMPKRVALSTIRTSSVGKEIAGRLINIRSHLRHDVGPVLAKSAKGYWEDVSQQFFLLPYASKNWIFHTSHVEHLDPLCHWYYLLQHPTFGIDLSDIPDSFVARRLSVVQFMPSDNMVWALSNGHLLLFKHELAKDRGAAKLQTYATLWIFLRYIEPEFIKNDMDYGLVRWLSWMLVRLHMTHPIKRQLLLRLSVFDESYMDTLRIAINLSDVEAVMALLSRDILETSQLPSVGEALMDLAVSYGNVTLLNLLMREDFPVDITGALAKIVTSGMPDPIVTHFSLYLLQQREIHLYYLSDSVLYLVLQGPLRLLGHDRIPTQLTVLPWGDLEGHRRKVDRLLHKACMRGDLPMVEMMISLGYDTNACTSEGSCLDVALHGISKDRLKIVWRLLTSSALPSFATLSRVVLLQQWAFVLYFLQFNISFDDPSSSHLDRAAPSFKIVVEDLDDIDYPFLGRFPIEDDHERDITALLPLPVVQSTSWDDWNFYFVANFRKDNGWKAMVDSEKKQFCNDLIGIVSYKMKPKEIRRDSVVRGLGIPETPKTVESSVEFVYWHPDLGPWIKLTTPNTFSTIAEISRRWNCLHSMEYGYEFDHNWILRTREKSLQPLWDDSGRLHSLGCWVMHRTIDTLEKRYHNYGLVRDALSDAAWAIKGLQNLYRLLQNLPSGSKIHVVEDTFPATKLPLFRQHNVSYMKAYSFSFAYMSVRIQFLRILGILSRKHLLERVKIDIATLQAALSLGKKELRGHDASTYLFMPEVLEAAFIGTEFKHVLQDLVASYPLWVPEVATWIETMDLGIFTWSMGQDSPLCFRRAFQSFRDIGTAERDMKILEDALDLSRRRIPELE